MTDASSMELYGSTLHPYKFRPGDLEEQRKGIQQGWQCPVCGAVYAPWVASCGNSHVKLTSASSTEYKP